MSVYQQNNPLSYFLRSGILLRNKHTKPFFSHHAVHVPHLSDSQRDICTLSSLDVLYHQPTISRISSTVYVSLQCLQLLYILDPLRYPRGRTGPSNGRSPNGISFYVRYSEIISFIQFHPTSIFSSDLDVLTSPTWMHRQLSLATQLFTH